MAECGGKQPLLEDRLEERIGYQFRNRGLLREAVTHKSFSNEQPLGARPGYNERLEFLGDAVLELVVSDYLFRRYPLLPEGRLTRIRAELVNERSLARLARDLDLGPHLLLGKGEEGSGGRDKESLLADFLEALIGAVFADGGLEPVARMVATLFDEAISEAADRQEGIDFKTRLQEHVQAKGWLSPEYRLVAAEGPEHRKLFTCEVRCEGKPYGLGRGRTKKAAEQEAARGALEKLGA
ncbi:MAG: ribonuclease III [Deltaproteobacteria bacterium]|nr:ribonuclease III [Deltaproteobacteria bacterium]